ncbi:MAG TPA: hypothetical protein VF980_11180 [Thermoanaerobaculia bacterium]
MIRIIAAVAVLLALPLIAFRGRMLWRSFALQLSVYAVSALAWRQVAGSFDPYLATVALFVTQLAIFSFLLATAPPDEVRWSANRAAGLALLVYLLMIPAMLRTPIDGDEPFYLLVTESIVHDHDLDLRNQYADLAHSATGRPDLRPQLGDPAGPHGELYSRHEPFLSLLLVPGYLAGGLPGALVTIALFGALLARSTVRLFEDEGVADATTRAVFPLFAFAPPVIFYAARIWPEVPAAFFFAEAVRGVRARRAQRWVPALLGLSLLKLRFLLVALPLLFAALKAVVRRQKAEVSGRRVLYFCLLLSVFLLPIALAWWATGSVTAVHSVRELVPVNPRLYAIGLFGLLVDGASGVLFQAPFYLLGILAIVRWRETPGGFRIGVIASLLYIAYLVPRSEWHGGWAPPLRYIVVFAPVFALGAAAVWERINSGVIALIAIWSAGLVAHGAAFPYRLFHIENGENVAGEALSTMYRTDFSRLFPSFVRLNDAAIVAGVLVVAAFMAFGFDRIRVPAAIAISIVAVALAAMFAIGQKPGQVVQFEDAHVVHDGGELYPGLYAVARFYYRGGWSLQAGDSLSFLSRGGPARLEYFAPAPVLVDIGGRAYQLPPSGKGFAAARIDVPRGHVKLRCLTGAINLDSLSF